MSQSVNIEGELPLVESLLKDRYAVNHLIARGPLSRVYGGSCVRDGRQVAIKVIDLNLLRRVGRLATARWARLNHPNVVRILDLVDFDHHGLHCCIMELLKGEQLDRFLDSRGHVVTMAGLLGVFNQAASGIDALHNAKILHLDLKPSNIVVPSSLEGVKIVDHGVSLAMELASAAAADSILGTPEYMAPERVIGANFSTSADIYSFAAVLYNLFAGIPLFSHFNRREIAYAQVHDAPIPLRSHNPIIPAYAADAIHRSLHKRPDQRHRTAIELMQEVSAGFLHHELQTADQFLVRDKRATTA
ncbi:MAG: serine/threonine protein kinase [Candidatus Sumerlaeia bacterium]|nr:serine/threonine protein kinase [Candidatus Sumerlaeia bacterium]